MPVVVMRRTAVSEKSPKLRAELEGIPTYKPGKPAAAGGPVAYKLSSNENPYPPLSGGDLAAGLNRYPEPQPRQLRDAMASLYGVQSEQLLLTRGGDDAIDVLCRAVLRGPEDAVVLCLPTFSVYAHAARFQGARVIEARLDANFDFSADAMLAGTACVALPSHHCPHSVLRAKISTASIPRGSKLS